ncbi:MAG: hypothetical protein HY806_05270 [Nitrospirae bacterium]|nr:hypothetical protein [Nitrospirota bacterium]
MLKNNKPLKPLTVFWVAIFTGIALILLINKIYLSGPEDNFYVNHHGKIPDEVISKQLKTNETIFLPRNYLGDYQRAYKKMMIIKRPKPRILVLGTSHSIKITADLFNVKPEEFYNAGIISASTFDILSLWQVALDHDKLPEIVIYVCSAQDFEDGRHFYFDKEFFELNSRSHSDNPTDFFKKYIFLAYLTVKDKWEVFKYAMRHYVIASQLKGMLQGYNLLPKTDTFQLKEKGVLSEERWAFNYDGSLIYDKNLELRDAENNQKEIMNHFKDNAERLEKEHAERKINSNAAELLEVFLQDAKRNNIKVIFVLPPYNNFGRKAIKQQLPSLFSFLEKSTNQIGRLAGEYSAESYLEINSSVYNCGDDEYTGTCHPKTSCYKKIFSRIKESTKSPLVKELIK